MLVTATATATTRRWMVMYPDVTRTRPRRVGTVAGCTRASRTATYEKQIRQMDHTILSNELSFSLSPLLVAGEVLNSTNGTHDRGLKRIYYILARADTEGGRVCIFDLSVTKVKTTFQLW